MISHNANKNAGDSCPCQKFESKYMTLPNCLLFFRTSKMSWQARWHCKVRLKSIQSCLSLGKIRFTKILKYRWRKLSISVLCYKKNLQYFIHLHYSSICKTQCTLTRNVNWDDELDGVTGRPQSESTFHPDHDGRHFPLKKEGFTSCWEEEKNL